jgi:Cu/Ag efflux pump CusA
MSFGCGMRQDAINTQAPGYSPLETEQRITFPVETAISHEKAKQHPALLSSNGPPTGDYVSQARNS